MVDVNQERELGWDDTIERESSFVLLPDGDYTFTVAKMERARFTPGPSSKIPACPMAKIELTVHSAEHGDQNIFHNLYLHTQTEGLLSAFFIGIGQKKKGEPLRMNWNSVVGATGKAKIKINKYRNNNGEEKQNNQVDHFYEPENYNQPQQAQAYQQPVQQQPAQTQQPIQQQPQPNNFQPGQF